MKSGTSQFVGAAGLYHLARELALRNIHAAITIGNAPSVDLMASSNCGRRTLSFQVKTSRNAHRARRYGIEGYEWDVSKVVIGKHSPSFWYAFIDLRQSQTGPSPQVFFVPSRWVAEFVKPTFSRFMYFLPASVKDLCYERWDLLEGYLKEQGEAVEWANSWPSERLVQWGKAPRSTNLQPPFPEDARLLNREG